MFKCRLVKCGLNLFSLWKLPNVLFLIGNLVQFYCMMCLSSFEFFVLLLLFFRFTFYKLHVVQLTLSLPNVAKGKFRPKFWQTKSTIWKYRHLNGHIIGFHLQTQKLESPYKTPSNTLAVKGLNRLSWCEWGIIPAD